MAQFESHHRKESCIPVHNWRANLSSEAKNEQMNELPSWPRQIFLPDPILGWRLSPNRQLKIGFRPDVLHTTNSEGWRSGLRQPEKPAATIGVYGCSFTYGTSLGDRETFCSLLQSRFRDAQILNRGIGGHGTVQSYLQFREDVSLGRVDAAIFAVIGDHKYRNMPHPLRMKAFLSMDWYRIGVEHYPCAVSKTGGGVTIHHVPIWQPVLQREDLSAFLPDEIMLNKLTVEVFAEIATFARKSNIPFHIVTLDRMDGDFNDMLLQEFDNATDISTPHDEEHRFFPHDLHPNTLAARLYADRLAPIVEAQLEKATAK